MNEFIFRGREFLLTGLSSQKERELEALIRNSGGVILYDIPSPPNSKGKRSSTLSGLQLPIILCNKKVCSHDQYNLLSFFLIVMHKTSDNCVCVYPFTFSLLPTLCY